MDFVSLRLCAEALTRGPGGLTPARDTHSCKETTFECSACSSSSHNNQNSCTSDALQSNMQHEKIGRFVSGGAYEGKQNTSGEQPDGRRARFPPKGPLRLESAQTHSSAHDNNLHRTPQGSTTQTAHTEHKITNSNRHNMHFNHPAQRPIASHTDIFTGGSATRWIPL